MQVRAKYAALIDASFYLYALGPRSRPCRRPRTYPETLLCIFLYFRGPVQLSSVCTKSSADDLELFDFNVVRKNFSDGFDITGSSHFGLYESTINSLLARLWDH